MSKLEKDVEVVRLPPVDDELSSEVLAQYDPRIERKLRLKLDFIVLPTVTVMYLFR